MGVSTGGWWCRCCELKGARAAKLPQHLPCFLRSRPVPALSVTKATTTLRLVRLTCGG